MTMRLLPLLPLWWILVTNASGATSVRVIHFPSVSTRLGMCTGNCDGAEDCEEGLSCYHRGPYEGVPGCEGGELDPTPTNYCVEGQLIPRPILLERTSTDDSSACGPAPPSSRGDEPKPPLRAYGSTPPKDKMPLGLCEGDCDDDMQCFGSLVCYQRDLSKQQYTVPGCEGFDFTSNTDYCFNANDNEEPEKPKGGENAVTYVPGKLTSLKAGLLLSEGLDARLIATSGDPVLYGDGDDRSIKDFHFRPDAGATYEDTREGNEGGFIYVSNSEVREHGGGGVGALTFNAQGQVIDYRMLLTGTTMNCGGGRTPWQTWVTCEEANDRSGKAYQVDPLGDRSSEMMIMGDEGGRWESFAFDDREKAIPRFFMTEDHPRGALVRFTPHDPDWSDPWSMLHQEGKKEYLKLHSNGVFEWIENRRLAEPSAEDQYPDTEGIDRRGADLLFVSKSRRMLFTLNLDNGNWKKSSTVSGLFDGQPDQIQRLLESSRDLLYFTEEGGTDAGVHARDENSRFYTILESPVYPGETTGLAMSPDGRFMIVAYQDVGKLFCVWRIDGLPFGAEHLDIKFHDN